MDDTIDEKDVAYVEGVIKGTNAVTNLSDANYDSKIDTLDIDRIKEIMDGEEKELTVNMYTRPSRGSTEITEVPVTIHKPVASIVPTSPYLVVIMRALKLEKDKIIGVDKDITDADAYFPEFSELPIVSSDDYEAILSLNPDLVIVPTSSFEESAKKLPGVTIVAFDCWRPEIQVDEIRRLGYILDKEDKAEEFIDFYNGVMNKINDTVGEIPVKERPKIYFESGTSYSTGAKGSGYHDKVTMAGGDNIFGDLSDYPKVDPEEVMKRNPEIIVKFVRDLGGYNYYLGTNGTELIDTRTEILSRPELAEVEAVKNGQVYVTTGDIVGATRHFIGMAYMAKWFYPDLFKDLDPKAIHQEYLTRFQGLPDDFLDTHDGIFVYPQLNES
jgi:iron complex transport system substrate-binding protein